MCGLPFDISNEGRMITRMAKWISYEQWVCDFLDMTFQSCFFVLLFPYSEMKSSQLVPLSTSQKPVQELCLMLAE